MKREDWIILRLIFRITKHDHAFAVRDLTVHRAIIDLTERYGTPTVLACINQLNREEQP